MKRLAIAFALLATGATAATLFSVGTAGAGQTPTVQMVREQNVDAQGNIKVHEQGTPQVLLTGSPRVGLDPTLGNTVKIDTSANTVKIDSAGSGPIQTQAADNPAFSPVVRRVNAQLGDGGFATFGSLYTVPTGDELVIEQVSVDGGNFDLADISLSGQSGGGGVPVFDVPLTHSNSGTVGDIQTRIYAAPGTEVLCEAARSSSIGSDSVSCSISGYLVPVK